MKRRFFIQKILLAGGGMLTINKVINDAFFLSKAEKVTDMEVTSADYSCIFAHGLDKTFYPKD